MTTFPRDAGKTALAPAPLIYGAFALGLTTAIAFRVIIILQHMAPRWVRPVWYFAVVGNLAFFFYRYRIAVKRKRAVQEHGLIARVEADTCFTPAEREALGYLLRSIERSPENINPCELKSPGSRRGRTAEFAGGRVLEGSHRLLPVGAPLLLILWNRDSPPMSTLPSLSNIGMAQHS